MSEKEHDGVALTVCAPWLQRRIGEWTDATHPVDAVAALDSLVLRVSGLLAYTTRGACLPVKDALQLQLAGQDVWNRTFLLTWPQDRTALKHRSRQLAALLFLASHHVFAPPGVFTAHMAHHLDDAEKCVLMCLKVSKLLVRYKDMKEAQHMLTWATAIAAAVRAASQNKGRQWLLEVHFALLHVYWSAGQLREACAVAEQLGVDVGDSATYREALLEFIYEAALGATSEEKPAIAREAALQSLLSLSLRLQHPEKVRSVKQQSLLGVTHLQLSCSYLRSGDHAQAVEAAASAYGLLHTFEPLVVRLRAEALARNGEAAAGTFSALCAHDSTVADAELCALATCVVESSPAMEAAVSAVLRRRLLSSALSQEERAEGMFRFVCFLLHVGSEWSVGAVVDLLDAPPIPLPPSFHRFVFCSIWRLAVAEQRDHRDSSIEEEATALHSPLSALLRWRCLRVSMTHFAARQTSPVERCSVLLEMSQLALAVHEGAPTDRSPEEEEGDENSASNVVQRTWELWSTESARQNLSSADEASALVAQAQLAFVLGQQEEALRRVEALWAGFDGSDAAPSAATACASLMNALLSRSLYREAGAVAQLCLPRLSSPSPQCALDVAKVCVLGFLSRDDDEDERFLHETANLLVAHVCPLWAGASGGEGAITLEPTVALWWGRLLWYIGDRLVDTRPAQAVRLSFAAVILHASCVHAEDGAEFQLLRCRLGALLEKDVELFCDVESELSVAETVRAHALFVSLCDAAEGATADGGSGGGEEDSLTVNARMRVVACLAGGVLELRQLQPVQHGEQARTEYVPSLASLPGMPSVDIRDLESAATACHRAAAALTLSLPALHRAAVSLQIGAAELQCRTCANRSDKEGVCATLSLLYDAYRMADDAEARAAVYNSLMALLRDTSLPLTNVLCNTLQRRMLDTCALPDHVACLVETAVEFFAVEAWNESVQWNVLMKRAEVATWRAWALSLADMLDASNASKAAISDFASQMPLL